MWWQWPREFGQSAFGIAGSNGWGRFHWGDACLGHFVVAAFFVLFSVGVSSAQVVHGSISGSILDATGAVVPDAKVRATSTATGATSNTGSGTAGVFRFAELPVGNYNLEVTKEGFSKYALSSVKVSAGADYGVGAIKLTVGFISQVVNVTAAPPLMESTEAQISTTFSTETLSSFVGVQENQGLDSLALLLPGVNNTRDDTYADTNGPGFSVNGLRGRSNDQQIDGQNNNDNGDGGPIAPLSNPDFVQAYQIVTNNFGPEYGRNSGALVNLVTPSGTNHWHGTIVATETNSALQTLSNTQKEFGLTKVPWFNSQFASTTIGGPAWKNRIFVFGGFDEQVRESKTYDAEGLTPTPNGLTELASCFPNSSSVAALRNYGPYGIHGGNPTPLPPLTDLTISGSNTNPFCAVEFGSVERTLGSPTHLFDIITRADFQWTNDRVYVRYFYNRSNFINDGAVAGGYPINDPSLSHSPLIGWTHLLTPQMTNEFRIGYQGGNYEAGGNGIGNTIPNKENIGEALASIGIDTDQGNPIAGFGPPKNLPFGNTWSSYQIQDNWSYVQGKSQWKAGVNSTHHTDLSVFLPYYNGEFSYQAFTNPGSTNLTTPDCTVAPGGSLTAFAAFACNIPTTINIADGSPTSQFHEQDTFLYVGNDYKLKPNFTINMGLTWSYYGQPANFLHKETVNRESNPATAFWNPTLPLSVRTVPEIPAAKNNWGPSIGFAWSPNWGKWLTGGSGKTVLRGGYRLAFDAPYYHIYTNVLVSAPVVLLQTLTGSSANANPLPAAPFGNNVRAAMATSLTRGALDPRAFDQTMVSPNFGPDHVHSWSLGIQREVTASSVFEIRYVGNHGQNLFQSINANPLIADLAASFPKYLPPGAVPCPANEAVVPSAIGRLNCAEGLMRERTNTGYSDYNGLQMQFRTTELWNQLTLMTSYTWSKTTDNVSEIFTNFGAGTTLAFSQNPLNYTTAEHGNSGIDFPHAWTVNFYEQIPAYRSQHGIVGHILGGWAVSGNYIISSGQPYSPVQSSLNYQTGGAGFDQPFDSLWTGTSETARPFVSDSRAPASVVGVFAADACAIFGAGCTLAPNALLNFNVLNGGGGATPVTQPKVHFIVNGAEAQTVFNSPYGNAARNSLRDAIINSGNFALTKTVRLNERTNFQWHMTMLNVFNHPNYYSVNPFLDAAGCSPLVECGFATPSASEATVRQILFGIKINW
jgi:hypothetical protein